MIDAVKLTTRGVENAQIIFLLDESGINLNEKGFL